MTTTPGPWGLRGHQIRANGGQGATVATYAISREDGFLIAAAPALKAALEALLATQPTVMAPYGKLYNACEDARKALAVAESSSSQNRTPPQASVMDDLMSTADHADGCTCEICGRLYLTRRGTQARQERHAFTPASQVGYEHSCGRCGLTADADEHQVIL